ncbi:MAG: type III pantothenate kinase [Planctomycetota bacterium]
MSDPLRLVVEVGNSRWKAGLFAPDASEPVGTVRIALGAAPGPPLTQFLAKYAPDGFTQPPVLAGVHPDAARALQSAWPSSAGPAPRELPRATLEGLIDNLTRQPRRVGTDRLLNALGAAAIAPPGASHLAVADCGTATTVDCVERVSETEIAFCGGAILPGAVLCARALHAHTAALPEVSFGSDLSEDGLDTKSAIRRGISVMQVAAVEQLLGEAAGPNAFPLLTGGAASLIAGRLRKTKPLVVPHLTLLGLFLAAEAA